MQFLRGGAITGQPVRVLTDGHDGTINAARMVCRDTRMYRSEWHSIRSVEKKLIAAKVHGNAKLMASFRQAFVNRYWCDQKVHRPKLPSVERQLDVIEPLIAEYWRTQPDEADRRIDPITSGGLARRMKPIGRWLELRAHLLSDKARLDRLLMLMQLQLDGHADEAAYGRPTRDWLGSRHGIAARRRGIADPADALSLHDGIRPKAVARVSDGYEPKSPRGVRGL